MKVDDAESTNTPESHTLFSLLCSMVHSMKTRCSGEATAINHEEPAKKFPFQSGPSEHNTRSCISKKDESKLK